MLSFFFFLIYWNVSASYIICYLLGKKIKRCNAGLIPFSVAIKNVSVLTVKLGSHVYFKPNKNIFFLKAEHDHSQ